MSIKNLLLIAMIIYALFVGVVVWQHNPNNTQFLSIINPQSKQV